MQKLIELDKIELNWWRREGVLSNNGNRKKVQNNYKKSFIIMLIVLYNFFLEFLFLNDIFAHIHWLFP